ncbi:hypothetical protein BDN70DRAFT_538915 [Pholiota conissans]|uniref:Chorismate mutase domain-containing protein n=1 Tax=Pholiota conissans TaxID=109636 RepID=A0A9P5ZFX2_9AGAR|nr:hypothetical protein BDN70DRAFT_538915 [Pholiota conissans]
MRSLIFATIFLVLLAGDFSQALSKTLEEDRDFAKACYGNLLPVLAPSAENRTVPWGSPSIVNGPSTCRSSLDEVRAGIDDIDVQLLELLSQRAAFVREATRFKALRGDVDVPSRDAQVIKEAVTNAPAVHLPQTIASAVFTAIINASVSFELCIFDSFYERGH